MELSTTTDTLSVTHSASITRIHSNDAKRNNVIDGKWISGFQRAINQAVDDKNSRIIIITSDGPHFCQGLDLDSLLSGSEIDRVHLFENFQNLLIQICECPLPVVASIEGKVTGGGLGLVAACDLVIASSTASFVLPEAISGMIPAIISPFLLRRLNPARLQALALSTRWIEAEEAQRWGLIDELVHEDLSKATDQQCQRILRSYPDALKHIKHLIRQIEGLNFEQQNAIALTQIKSWLERKEVLDGIQTFNDGFSPEWFEKMKKQS